MLDDIPLTIVIRYSCAVCGLRQIPVEVPARESEEVAVWLEHRAVPWLMRDHHRRSPECAADRFSEVFVPMAHARRVGAPMRH